MLALLGVMVFGATANAEVETYFWSESVPMPSCVGDASSNRESGDEKEGTFVTGKFSISTIDGNKKNEEELPTCSEAKKNLVLVVVDELYLNVRGWEAPWPYIENGRTMVPMRAIADAFKFKVDWEASKQKITLTREGTVIVMHIGKSEMLVNGEKVLLEGTTPAIKKGVTFLPIGQLAKTLGIEVEWDAKTRTATFK
ncbi:hypothetical protein PA598K_00821 [Paenibacillus sp. 598K]|nr:hypothetical protein PA598K_00821 [Paenibacillus sp. 598K]